MRALTCFTALLMMGAAPLAFAQEGNYSQTLNEQKARVDQGESAVPYESAASRHAPTGDYSDRRHPPHSVGGAIPALPLDVQTQGDITYITGGIGEEEEAQLRAGEKDYNLRLLMTSPSGEYVSEVKLNIMKGGTQVLSVDGTGPYFYAKLQPGTYTVEALASDGNSRKFNVKVPAKGMSRQQVMFR